MTAHHLSKRPVYRALFYLRPGFVSAHCSDVKLHGRRFACVTRARGFELAAAVKDCMGGAGFTPQPGKPKMRLQARKWRNW